MNNLTENLDPEKNNVLIQDVHEFRWEAFAGIASFINVETNFALNI